MSSPAQEVSRSRARRRLLNLHPHRHPLLLDGETPAITQSPA